MTRLHHIALTGLAMRRIIGTIAATLVISIVMATSASAAVNDPRLGSGMGMQGTGHDEVSGFNTGAFTLAVPVNDPNLNFVQSYDLYYSLAVGSPILNDGGVPQISPANTYV